MSLDSLTNTEYFKAAAAVITGGAFVGWLRERRKGRKDAYAFAMDFMDRQSKELAAERLRVDALVLEMATIKAGYASAAEAVTILKTENAALKIEIIRLQTALGEHRRGDANNG